MKKLLKFSITLSFITLISLNFMSCTAEDINSDINAEEDAKPQVSKSRPLTGIYDKTQTSKSRPLTGFYGETNDKEKDGTQEKRRSKVLEDI